MVRELDVWVKSQVIVTHREVSRAVFPFRATHSTFAQFPFAPKRCKNPWYVVYARRACQRLAWDSLRTLLSLEASTRHIPDPSVRKAIVAGHVEKHVLGNVPYASVHCISWRGMRYRDGSRRQRLGVQVRRSGRSPEHFRQHQVAALIGDAGLCGSSGRHVQGALCCLMLLGGTCASF